MRNSDCMLLLDHVCVGIGLLVGILSRIKHEMTLLTNLPALLQMRLHYPAHMASGQPDGHVESVSVMHHAIQGVEGLASPEGVIGLDRLPRFVPSFRWM